MTKPSLTSTASQTCCTAMVFCVSQRFLSTFNSNVTDARGWCLCLLYILPQSHLQSRLQCFLLASFAAMNTLIMQR